MEEDSLRKNNLSERFVEFAINGIKLSEQLNQSYAEVHIARQLMRSVTSCGANYEEACGAESKADFIHKLQIVLKELKETQYWLKLLCTAKIGKNVKVETFSCECDELSRIIGKSIITTKSNAKCKMQNIKMISYLNFTFFILHFAFKLCLL